MNELWVIDFDRTLGDVDKLYGLLRDIIVSEQFFDVSKLDVARKRTEERGGSFDALGECRALLSSREFATLVGLYAQPFDSDTYLLPGAQEFLVWLQQTERHYMIMTYGRAEWQRAKLIRTGLVDYPYMVTSTPVKAKLLASWRGQNGFVVPRDDIVGGDVLVAETERLVIVDDKAASFGGITNEMRGYWVQSGVGSGDKPASSLSSVRAVSSLSEIMEREGV